MLADRRVSVALQEAADAMNLEYEGTRQRTSWYRLQQLLGTRPAVAEHTAEEGAALRRCAEGAATLVEIGVADGGSAWELRQVMHPAGTLFLVDPYPSSRWRFLRLQPAIARRLVAGVRRGNVHWIDKSSTDAADSWRQQIDFLFIDADHDYLAVKEDWRIWSPWVSPGGFAALHDAVICPARGISATDGPVRIVNEILQDRGSDFVMSDAVDSLAILQRSASAADEIFRSDASLDERLG